MKKKLLAVLLCAAMTVTLAACGKGDGDNTQKQPVQVDPPTVTKLAAFDDMKAILTGDYEVTDEMMESGVRTVLFTAEAGLIEVTDRDTVQEGDIVLTGYAGAPNKELAATLEEDELKTMKENMSTAEGKEQLIDVSGNCGINESDGAVSGEFIKGDWGTFTGGLVGAKIGEAKEHEVTFPEKYQEEKLAGQKATFTFTVEKIYTKVTLETLTDEYVKEHLTEEYEMETVADVKAYVRERLSCTNATYYLVKESKVDVPENYLNARVDAYIELAEASMTNGLTLEMALQLSGQTLEQAKAAWAQDLKSQIQIESIYKELVKSKSITLDEEKHQKYLDDVLENNENFTTVEDVYMAAGAGDAEAGEHLLANESAINDYILQMYNDMIAKEAE